MALLQMFNSLTFHSFNSRMLLEALVAVTTKSGS
jgi:hypothetical protein